MTLTTEQLENFKAKLVKEKTTLEEELGSLGRQITPDGDWMAVPPEQPGLTGNDDPDDNVQADYSNEFESRIAELSVLEARYRDVKAALAKIDGDKYGICEISGEEIELDRLEANPAARTNKAHMNDDQ